MSLKTEANIDEIVQQEISTLTTALNDANLSDSSKQSFEGNSALDALITKELIALGTTGQQQIYEEITNSTRRKRG